MPRSFNAILSCVFLVSVMAIGFSAGPVQADTYRLTATSTNLGWVSDFALSYSDNDGDKRMSIDELVPRSFTGVDVHMYWWASDGGYWQFQTAVDEVPSGHYGDPCQVTDGEGGLWWGFSVYPALTGCAIQDNSWTYGSAMVPLPPTVLLLGSGLLGLVGWRRFRKS